MIKKCINLPFFPFLLATSSQIYLPHRFQYLLSSNTCRSGTEKKIKVWDSSCRGEHQRNVLSQFHLSLPYLSLFPSCTNMGLSCIFSVIDGGRLGRIYVRLHANPFLRVLLDRFLPLGGFTLLPSSLVFRSCYSLEGRVAWSWILLFVQVLDDTEQYQLACSVFQTASMPKTS